jgi:hypothetical protein
MKTKIYQPLKKNSLPDGEGFIALPISFNSVIASRRLAMTKYQR